MKHPLLFACLAVSGLGACSKKIDNEKLEKSIRDELLAPKGVMVSSVSCPSGRTAKAGDKFTCAVTTSKGESITVTVEQKDDSGNLITKTEENLLDPKGVTATLASKLGMAADTTTTCAQSVLKVGQAVICKLTDAKGTKDVELKITSADGAFEWKEKGDKGDTKPDDHAKPEEHDEADPAKQ